MRVLEDMEKGGNEWKKPWVEASPLPPHNPVSGTQYSGRNFLYTYVYGMMRGYADPRWATEKQIKEMGWKIPENLQNGSADDKRGNRLHVGTGQNAQIYFDPKSGEFIGNSNMSTTISTSRTAQSSISSCPAQPASINRAISVRNSRSLTSNLK